MGDHTVKEDAILKALDKPRSLYSILQVVDPSGSSDLLQDLLLQMRTDKKVTFDIRKGKWKKA